MSVRLLLLPVYQEEGWHSINLYTEMLEHGLAGLADPGLSWQRSAPPYRWRMQHLPGLEHRKVTHNVDRLLNRFYDYPRHVRRECQRFDLFHLCDHSYAQLAGKLPHGRMGVMCHDLDVFRSVLEPAAEPRPWWFQQMTWRILAGFRRAAVVFYTTDHVRSQIEQHRLIDSERLVQAPLGIAPEFLHDPGHAAESLPDGICGPYLLHVGSCIPRKRIDILLRVFAGVRSLRPDVRLVKVGGPWTPEQQQLLRELGVADAITVLQGVSRETLAQLYRQAAVTLVPSDREGFGLPVIEALACGSPVLANSIPPLKEGGGQAAEYRTIDDISGWVQDVIRLLDHPETAPPLAERQSRGRSFSWQRHAAIIAQAYQQLHERLATTVRSS